MAENAEQEIVEFLKDPREDEAIPLMVRLMQHSHNETNAIMNQLRESDQREIKNLRSELALIRKHIESLYAGPYMPMPDLVLGALYPNEELVESFQSGNLRFRGDYS